MSAIFGSPATIGGLFLTDYLLAFELVSLLLLVAAIAGVVLGAGTAAERPRSTTTQGGREASASARAAPRAPAPRATSEDESEVGA